MILLVNPRATKPWLRRFPLSIMALGAALPEDVAWDLVDGNKPEYADLVEVLRQRIEAQRASGDPVSLLAFTVMPGPQLAAAVPVTKRIKALFPEIPVVWGGYFASLYPQPVGNAPFIDFLVRGQGEKTFLELLDVLAGKRDPATVAGLGWKKDGALVLNPERPWIGPGELPAPPYHRIHVPEYLEKTHLGARSGVYQASIGCPYTCSFCGVISVYGSREKFEEPARTAKHLAFLANEHGMDSVHFYDNSFFQAEAHGREVCDRLTPLGLSWWCESRIDVLLNYKDDTFRAMKASGLRMVFFGAESGSNEVLAKMEKRLTIEETLALAARIKEWDIVPEFSFVLGGPEDPGHEIDQTLALMKKLKDVNPAAEMVFYFYTPTPQRRAAYGGVNPLDGTPEALEDWTAPEWVDFMTHEKPDVPWMTEALRAKVLDFELILKSRFPSLHDLKTRPWGKVLAQRLARRRWADGDFRDPRLIRSIRKFARIPKDDTQLYGHLRPPAEPA